MSKLSHNDNPNGIDAFDNADFIKHIAEVIKTCEPPKGIAINGYWGSGKTSALYQLHQELVGILPAETKKPNKRDIATVWFEAWRYQNSGDSLIHYPGLF